VDSDDRITVHCRIFLNYKLVKCKIARVLSLTINIIFFIHQYRRVCRTRLFLNVCTHCKQNCTHIKTIMLTVCWYCTFKLSFFVFQKRVVFINKYVRVGYDKSYMRCHDTITAFDGLKTCQKKGSGGCYFVPEFP